MFLFIVGEHTWSQMLIPFLIPFLLLLWNTWLTSFVSDIGTSNYCDPVFLRRFFKFLSPNLYSVSSTFFNRLHDVSIYCRWTYMITDVNSFSDSFSLIALKSVANIIRFWHRDIHQVTTAISSFCAGLYLFFPYLSILRVPCTMEILRLPFTGVMKLCLYQSLTVVLIHLHSFYSGGLLGELWMLRIVMNYLFWRTGRRGMSLPMLDSWS